MQAEGVDHSLLICEYSPKATGIQRFEEVEHVRGTATGNRGDGIQRRFVVDPDLLPRRTRGAAG